MSKINYLILQKSVSFFSFFLLQGLVFSARQEDILVKTSLGSIVGTTRTSRNGTNFYSFRGIRYAKPLVGQFRFKPPVPVEPWDGNFNATEEGPACPQETFLISLNQSEDCLRLNIYTRQIGKAEAPVLFHIHGGGFIGNSGQSGLYGPEYLLDHDIVLVTMNYRLGALGFFSTGDKFAPGNYGLKDQVEALKWVKNNIRYFGGDPSRITIVGESAGAASVGLHLVSPMSRGLFHRAMMLSGSAISPWVLNKNPSELAWKQATLLNCSTDSSESIVDCMSKVPAGDLLSIHKNLTIWLNERRLNKAVVEADDGKTERFLVKHPFTSLLQGDIADVPIFIGTTKDEMVERAFHILRDEKQSKELFQNWTELAPIICGFEQVKRNDTISLKLREFYIDNTNDTIKGLGELISDSFVTFGVIRSAKLLSEKNKQPVFLYQFNYLGKDLNPHSKWKNISSKIGHTHDVNYIFYSPLFFPVKLHENNSDTKFVTKFSKLWKNFVETGDPTPEASEELDFVTWEPYTNENPKYLDINTNLTLRNGLYNEKRMSMWENLFPIPGKN